MKQQSDFSFFLWNLSACMAWLQTSSMLVISTLMKEWETVSAIAWQRSVLKTYQVSLKLSVAGRLQLTFKQIGWACGWSSPHRQVHYTLYLQSKISDHRQLYQEVFLSKGLLPKHHLHRASPRTNKVFWASRGIFDYQVWGQAVTLKRSLWNINIWLATTCCCVMLDVIAGCLRCICCTIRLLEWSAISGF